MKDIKLTKECIEREISDANAYYKLYFDWLNIIRRKNKAFYNDFEHIFSYVEGAIDTKYILSLTKIFASKKEESLKKLLFSAKNISQKYIEIKLGIMISHNQDYSRKQRKLFLQNFDLYICRINKIEKRLNPLRNIQRAHNFPYRPKGPELLWAESRRYLKFAETIFVRAMDSICEDCPRVGSFLPDTFDYRIKYFGSVISKIQVYKSKNNNSRMA